MTASDQSREFSCLARYLTGKAGFDSTPYAISKYQEFHNRQIATFELDPFDEFLVRCALRGPFWTRLADSYASRFFRKSVLRKKLVLVLAILESSEDSSRALDFVERTGTVNAILRLGSGVIRYAGCLAISFLLFTPARIRFGLSRRVTQRTMVEGRWIP